MALPDPQSGRGAQQRRPENGRRRLGSPARPAPGAARGRGRSGKRSARPSRPGPGSGAPRPNSPLTKRRQARPGADGAAGATQGQRPDLPAPGRTAQTGLRGQRTRPLSEPAPEPREAPAPGPGLAHPTEAGLGKSCADLTAANSQNRLSPVCSHGCQERSRLIFPNVV